jgi:putative (di)nucleoside polyphosphate hydrolase
LRLAVPESSVAFDFKHTSEPEFDAWRWSNYWEPVREVIYFKRPVYVRMLTELATVAFPGGSPPLPDWWQSELAAAAEA